MKRIFAVVAVTVPLVAAGGAAASAATSGSPSPLTIAIPATPVSTAGAFTIVLSPPDPCDAGVAAQPNCVDVIPGLLQIALSPPDPCDGLCPATDGRS